MKPPQSCTKSVLPVSPGQDWQPLAPPASNHQDRPSAPTHGLDGRGQGHGLSSSSGRSPGPRGTSCDPGLGDHPQPPAKPAGCPRGGEGLTFLFTCTLLSTCTLLPLGSWGQTGDAEDACRWTTTLRSGSHPRLSSSEGGGGREAEPHACSTAHTAFRCLGLGGAGGLLGT